MNFTDVPGEKLLPPWKMPVPGGDSSLTCGQALLSLSTFLPSSAHPWHLDGAALSLTCWVGFEGEVPTVIVVWDAC